ncbi:hypothetical protein RIF29_29768 [Crotalaria pallida]|uniref:Uncharacterized protein n=1 Tax=Crotalaria pallida TaxID=3830 RepID=A0AAN9EFH2_CROPI
MNLKDESTGAVGINWSRFFGVVVLNYTKSIEKAMENAALISVRRREAYIGWICPSFGVFKLNIDGSVHANAAACSGLVRDHTGSFLKGFTCNVGISL